jgi:hypothetical protein
MSLLYQAANGYFNTFNFTGQCHRTVVPVATQALKNAKTIR